MDFNIFFVKTKPDFIEYHKYMDSVKLFAFYLLYTNQDKFQVAIIYSIWIKVFIININFNFYIKVFYNINAENFNIKEPLILNN